MAYMDSNGDDPEAIGEAEKEFQKLDSGKDYDWDGREIVQVIKLAGIHAQFSYNSTVTNYRKANNIKQVVDIICKHFVY
jgi:hypothetical protein